MIRGWSNVTELELEATYEHFKMQLVAMEVLITQGPAASW
jgi:hypothetical protein